MGENTKPFDNASKRLLMVSSQDLLEWLSPCSQFVGQFSEQFHSAEIEADAMIETRCNGLCKIVHFEFQSGPDTDMAQRLLEYYIQAYRRYRCPVRSFVLYLHKSGALPASPLIRTYSDGKEFLRFHFQVVPLCDIPHREILDLGKPGLLPLGPLMDGGVRHEVVEEIITRLLPTHGTIEGREHLTLTSLFACLAFTTPEDKAWSRRRFAMLKDIFTGTPQHEYYLQLTREEVSQSLLQAQRKSLLMIVQARFPKLVKLAKAQAGQIKDMIILEEVVGKVGAAQSAEEVTDILLSWLPDDDAEE
jgi:hypothetical protein